MKILLSAFGCNPMRGSEGAVGWTVAAALARQHDVWALTHEENREGIEAWAASHSLPPRLRFAYLGAIGTYSSNPIINRFQCWRTNFVWHQQVLELAQKLHQEHKFDLVHHVTCATWRVASPHWKLGIPVVWGPLGGGERFPAQCAGILSPVSLAFEIVRGVGNVASARNRNIRQCAREVAVCVGANQETTELLRRLRGKSTGVTQLLQVFIPPSKIQEFSELVPNKDFTGSLRLFAGGILEARKGVAIALEALAQPGSVPCSYTVGGGGPERNHLEKLASRLGVRERVVFSDGFKGAAYRDELLKSHIFLMPSLRESAGITLMEAMLAGCVPIVADCGGPHDIVTDECGFRITVDSPRRMAAKISEILQQLHKDRQRLQKMGMAAHQRIATNFNEEAYLRSITKIFLSAVT